MLEWNRKTSFLYGGNAPYIEELYEAYLADPGAVSGDWRAYFDAMEATPARDASWVGVNSTARKQVAVQSMVAAYRTVGTRRARIDPLGWTPVANVAELSPAFHGLSPADLSTTFSTADSFFGESDLNLLELEKALEETYCGTLGAEFMHLADTDQRRWWQMQLESTRGKVALPSGSKLRILERLTAAEGLEKHLHTRYVGQTRFSLEGAESLIVLLDELIRTSASRGVRNIVMGMAHRGRLNVLVNIAGKPLREVFDEFEGRAESTLLAGDVKYHEGYTGKAQTDAGPVEVLLASNPSHLEFVNPVVEGMARARIDALQSPATVLPVEIHGEAAIAGQGVVMETMSLAHTRGHGTGGTMHVVVNNQVGFTTSDPRDTRSSFYCTDIAKMIEAPILHVNGDDPEAVVKAVQLAVAYRTKFGRSVVIELVCFRRHGHQEQDTPEITQPLMYRFIAKHPGIRSLYADVLVRGGLLSAAGVEDLQRTYRDSLESAHSVESHARVDATLRRAVAVQSCAVRDPYAAPPLEDVLAWARRITEIPSEYVLHPLVARMMAARREMASGTRPLDWGMGEHLAFASVLSKGMDVRLSGQDSERGTFGHRHAALHNQDRGSRSDGVYEPLAHLSESQGRFTVINSILSEAAVMAFEYGYSIVHQDALVLWEAQYGDFANGAQVVIDQFLSAGEAKWGQRSGLILLLPHGQEGQGPEHASARLERYLQLCAQDNMAVCQPTTPAQFFHLLRRQAMMSDRPLVVMTPKSLLRHPAAVSSLEELADGTFHEVLGESRVHARTCDTVKRAILCSGKVYYELFEYRRAKALFDTVILRLEQLYPFPVSEIRVELARYPSLKTLVWCQEEPQNQGAWTASETKLRALSPGSSLRFAGPPPAASPAPGLAAAHRIQQATGIADAFRDGIQPDSDAPMLRESLPETAESD